MKRNRILVLIGLFVLVLNAKAQTRLEETTQGINKLIDAGQYKAKWESLKQHTDPEWFRDAKFGIYTHWGPSVVGTEGGGGQWYGYDMYNTNNSTFEYHRKKYGEHKTFGYKDIVPLLTGEKFNADEWADLFVRSGAKFAGPVAVHHDNFAMWNSELTRWNSFNMGPHRDVTGELAKAIKSRGLKFITTFHHGYAWRYYEFSFKYDGSDPKNADLYTDFHAPMAPPSIKFQDQWLAMVYEVLGKYKPDLIWFDFELYKTIQPEYQQKMFAMTYDWALQQNRTIGICQKDRKIHESTSILDFERGREDDIKTYPWLTDSPVGNWFYEKSADYKSVGQLVTTLVDIVSKNGCLLLNVGPKVDGTIPDRDCDVLLGIGDWLKINGEAIYATRPWKVFGEGPTSQRQAGAFSEHNDKLYTSSDIRFTQSKDKKALYAIALGTPKDGKIAIKSLAAAAGKISDVTLVGYSGKIQWVQTDSALVVTLPAENKCVNAVTLKIKAGELNPTPAKYEKVAVGNTSGVYKLLYSDAVIYGTTPIIQNGDGESRISQWENPNDFVSWEVQLDQVGTYEVELKYSCKEQSSEFTIEMGTQKISGKTTPTGMWKNYRADNVGLLYIEKSGKYTLFLKPKSIPKWNGIGLNSITIKRML